MSLELSGQVALVTGAARGIGEGICHRLAKAGAEVVVADLEADKAALVAERLSKSGIKSYHVGLDVRVGKSVEEAFEAVRNQSGQIDILVNNAGVVGRDEPVWKQTDEDWTRVIEVNLTGVFLCCRTGFLI